MTRRVLGVFAKEPRPGLVKTRLAASRSAEWAAKVARAFLADTLQKLAAVECRRVLAVSPPESIPYFAALAEDRFTLCPQVEGTLGQRMAAFFREQLRDGADAVVLVGADSPTLPAAFIGQAFVELESADVVLGPALDGGYYLIGCRRFLPHLFEGIAWSTNQVLQQTIARLRGTPEHLALLLPWYDVDTPDDWRLLQGHVAALRRAGVDPSVPHIEQLLADEPS